MLQEFVRDNRDEIIRRCRTKVETRSAPPPTKGEIDHGVPMFLDQLLVELDAKSPNAEIRTTATKHGKDLLRQGFTVSQVVHDYGDVCQSITELALERDAHIGTDDFRTLNRCLDDAIASAVTEFGRDRDVAVPAESPAGAGLVAVIGELRTSVHIASVALDVIRSGSVGMAGSTGQLLDGHIGRIEQLLDTLLDEFVAARRNTAPQVD